MTSGGLPTSQEQLARWLHSVFVGNLHFRMIGIFTALWHFRGNPWRGGGSDSQSQENCDAAKVAFSQACALLLDLQFVCLPTPEGLAHSSLCFPRVDCNRLWQIREKEFSLALPLLKPLPSAFPGTHLLHCHLCISGDSEASDDTWGDWFELERWHSSWRFLPSCKVFQVTLCFLTQSINADSPVLACRNPPRSKHFSLLIFCIVPQASGS